MTDTRGPTAEAMERAKEIMRFLGVPVDYPNAKHIAHAIDEAVREQRERDAEVCEQTPRPRPEAVITGAARVEWGDATHACAHRIRTGGTDG